DRNGAVTARDQIISRGNVGDLTKINISSPPAAPQVAESKGDSLSAVASALGGTLSATTVSTRAAPPGLSIRLDRLDSRGDVIERLLSPSVERNALAMHPVPASADEGAERFDLYEGLLDELVGGLR